MIVYPFYFNWKEISKLDVEYLIKRESHHPTNYRDANYIFFMVTLLSGLWFSYTYLHLLMVQRNRNSSIRFKLKKKYTWMIKVISNLKKYTKVTDIKCVTWHNFRFPNSNRKSLNRNLLRSWFKGENLQSLLKSILMGSERARSHFSLWGYFSSDYIRLLIKQNILIDVYISVS